MHVPDLDSNLFSILTLTESGEFAANIVKESITFSKAGETLLTTFITFGKVAYLSARFSLHLSMLTLSPHCLWIILYGTDVLGMSISQI